MKTLKDYIKGYNYVPLLQVAEHRAKDGTLYSLVKQEGYDSFYFLKGEEVIKREWLPMDKYPDLAIKRLNNKRDGQITAEICEQPSYNKFVKFVFDQTGEEFKI